MGNKFKVLTLALILSGCNIIDRTAEPSNNTKPNNLVKIASGATVATKILKNSLGGLFDGDKPDEEESEFEVYYGDGSNDKYLGRVIGLGACRARAISHAKEIGEDFKFNGYYCSWLKDGTRISKHR